MFGNKKTSVIVSRLIIAVIIVAMLGGIIASFL
jgi:hypothetical protein